jgi:hypothetical protein
MIVNTPIGLNIMARNKNAGKSTAKSRSGIWYATKATKEQLAKKNKKSKEVNERPEQVAKRVALGRTRRPLVKAGKIRKDQDLSHTSDGRLVKEDFRKNRARNRGRKPA